MTKSNCTFMTSSNQSEFCTAVVKLSFSPLFPVGALVQSVEFCLLFSPNCQMNAKHRPSFSQIVVELERRQAERKQKDEPTVKGESSNAL